MGISSTNPTTRRGYLSQSELEQFANITVTDTAEADDRISQAEELIDAYVGYVKKFMEYEVIGRAVGAGSTTLTLETTHQNTYEKDFFVLCEVEIIGGTGQGQRRKISGSTKAGVLTVASTWSTTPDTTSMYKIYQLGRFPRNEDVTFYSTQEPNSYYKSIPENVKRAVAAQVEFAIEMGDAYFSGDKSEMQSESIGDYSYSRGNNPTALSKLIAPRAKVLLRGYINRSGNILI